MSRLTELIVRINNSRSAHWASLKVCSYCKALVLEDDLAEHEIIAHPDFSQDD